MLDFGGVIIVPIHEVRILLYFNQPSTTQGFLWLQPSLCVEFSSFVMYVVVAKFSTLHGGI